MQVQVCCKGMPVFYCIRSGKRLEAYCEEHKPRHIEKGQGNVKALGEACFRRLAGWPECEDRSLRSMPTSSKRCLAR